MADSQESIHAVWEPVCAAAEAMATGGCRDLALQYMIGGKLFTFMSNAEGNPVYARELPWLIERICKIFTHAELDEYLKALRKPMSHTPKDRARHHQARDLLLYRNFRFVP